MLGGKLIVRSNKRPVQIFTTQPEDEPLQGSVYFLFDGIDDEKELLRNIISNDAAGIVVREGHGLHINKWKRKGINVIEVPHMTEPYIKLSRIYRSQFDIPFIEVIGSSGKTTTKEMIGAVLNEKMPTLVSLKNYNAPLGVAYNIFCLREKHKAAVLEVGMKGPGIMEYSSRIVKPDIAVVTSIHRAHLARMGSIENIINSKAEILKCLSENGTLIINGEDENCNKFPLKNFKGEVLRFGFSDKFDIYATDIKCINFKMNFTAVGKGFKETFVIDTVGIYNVSNALAAILVGLKLGLYPQEISRGLSKFKTLKGRLKFYKGINDTVIIDDNFNANPDSTKLLIDEIPHFAESRPVVLVLGDMENPDDSIGKYALEVHSMIGEQLAQIKLGYLAAIGKWAKAYADVAVRCGFPKEKAVYHSSIEEAKRYFLNYVIPGSVIIFKASVYTDFRELIEPLKVK